MSSRCPFLGFLPLGLALFWGTPLGAAEPSLAARSKVAIVIPSDPDPEVLEAARVLRGRLLQASVVRTSSVTGDIPALLRISKARWKERRIVVLDVAEGRVVVLRPEDGTMLARQIDQDLMEEAPYAVALAASELLDIADEVSGRSVPEEELEDGTYTFGLGADAGVAVTGSNGDDAVVVQPAFAISGLVRRSRSPVFVGLSARLRVQVESSKTFAPLGRSRVEYRRHDAGLGLVLGRTLGVLDLAIRIEPGASFSAADRLDSSGAELDHASSVTPTLGGGFDVRVHLGVAGLALSVSAGATCVFVRTRFCDLMGSPEGRCDGDAESYEEGAFRFHGVGAVRWEVP